MKGKYLLLMIAVMAIGIFALPQSVSLFSGQHTWYDISGRGNDVLCEKCHADIANEMDALVGPHTGETGYGRMKCEYCHRVFPIEHKNASFDTYTYASGDGEGAESGKEAHAASTVPCMYCHSGDESGYVIPHASAHHDEESDCLHCHADRSGHAHGRVHGNAKYFNNEDCYKCHLYKNGADIVTIRIPPAGGFGLTTNTSDTGEMAAHKTFVMEAISNLDMEDANEACIACHTHTSVKINWTHRRSLEFNASFEEGLFPPAHFNVSDFTANGSANVTVYDNASGGGSTSGW